VSGDAAEVPRARLRWGQACARLRERFPNAAKDPQLASLMNDLGDALGAGPGASEPDGSLLGEVFRVTVAPDLFVVVDGSCCVVLEVTEGAGGRVLRRPTVAAVDHFKSVLDDARAAQQAAMAEAGGKRVRGTEEKRRAEGKLTKTEAVEWLTGKGYTRSSALRAAVQIQTGKGWPGKQAEGMTYDGTYWVVPASQG
jgi:hypothetical protein